MNYNSTNYCYLNWKKMNYLNLNLNCYYCLRNSCSNLMNLMNWSSTNYWNLINSMTTRKKNWNLNYSNLKKTSLSCWKKNYFDCWNSMNYLTMTKKMNCCLMTYCCLMNWTKSYCSYCLMKRNYWTMKNLTCYYYSSLMRTRKKMIVSCYYYLNSNWKKTKKMIENCYCLMS